MTENTPNTQQQARPPGVDIAPDTAERYRVEQVVHELARPSRKPGACRPQCQRRDSRAAE